MRTQRQELIQVSIDTITILQGIIKELSEQNRRLTDEISRLRGSSTTELPTRR